VKSLNQREIRDRIHFSLCSEMCELV